MKENRIALRKVSTKKGFNPRDMEHFDRKYRRELAASMKSGKQIDPILLREGDNELIDGFYRLSAAKQLHWKEIDYRTIKATDTEARHLALIKGVFGRKLNPLEIGKATHNLLAGIKQGERTQAKNQLAKELGIGVSQLEDYMTTFNEVAPAAMAAISTAVAKQLVSVPQLREIRVLPKRSQVAISKQIANAKMPSDVENLISGIVASQPQFEIPPSMNEQPTDDPQELAPQKNRFFSVLTRELKGSVESVTENDLVVSTKKNGKAKLSEEIRALLVKAKAGDLLTLTLLLETSPEHEQKVPDIKVNEI